MKLLKTIDDIGDVDAKYQDLYENIDGILTLTIETEGVTSVDGLVENSKKLKSEKMKLQERLDNLEGQIHLRDEESLKAEGDYNALLELKEKAFQEKLEQANEKAEQATTLFRDSILDREIQHISTELAGDNAGLIAPHLKGRLSINEDNEIVITDILGNASLLSSADLIKEFSENEVYKPLTSRASSGSGASGSETANQTTDVERYFNPQHADYSPTKQGELEQSDPEIYKSLSSKFNLDDPFAVTIMQPGRPSNQRR